MALYTNNQTDQSKPARKNHHFTVVVAQQQPQNIPKRKHFLSVGVFIGVCPAVI
jgi:hypothetical protein